MKAALLDIDGTLAASNDAHAQAWSTALREFSFDVPFEEIRRWIGMGGDKILPRVQADLSDDREPGLSIVALRQRIFMDRYVADLQPTPGAVQLLRELRARKLLCVAATSATKKELDAIARAAGIAGGIDLATTADDAERSKPDADIVESALAKAGADRSQAIYLGDTPYDIEAAHKANVAVVALECGGWSAAELARAEAVYATPAALLEQFDRSPFARAE
jgi:HAD superfamily hydrolase (TIGR01509 family)